MAFPAQANSDTPVGASPPRTAYALVLIKTPGIEVLAISEDAGRIEHERAELEDATPGLEPDRLLVLEAIVV